MTDWRALAQARGLTLSASELDRLAHLLETLEHSLRPRFDSLAPADEPALILSGFGSESAPEGD